MAVAFAAPGRIGVIDTPLSELLRQAEGLRNIAVHQCEHMDWNIVFDVATKRYRPLATTKSAESKSTFNP